MESIKDTKNIHNNIIYIKLDTKFSAEYVNRLHRMVKKNITIPRRFICFTDNPKNIDSGIEVFLLPQIHIPDCPEHGWRKLSIFNKQLENLQGIALCLDVDVVIINNINYLFEGKGEFRIIKNWNYPKNSYVEASSCRFNIGKHADIIEYFESRASKICKNFKNEQEYLNWKIKEKSVLQYCKPQTSISFKHSCIDHSPLDLFKAPKQPNNNTKLLMFHSKPLPNGAINGYFNIKRSQRICRKILG